MKPILKTKLIAYRFDIADKEQALAYKALCAKLKGRNHLHANADSKEESVFPTDGALTKEYEIELETKHMFSNQWNSTTHRVFDWYEGIYYNNGRRNVNYRSGHYLELTDEMLAAREERHVCGYCGAQYGFAVSKPKPQEFCDKCLDSPYLEETNLPLLRLVAVSKDGKRPALSADEENRLVPVYREAQLRGNKARSLERVARERARVMAIVADTENKNKRAILNATEERDGLLWLLDHDLSTENVIYYSHTGRFGFGWLRPIVGENKSALEAALCEFPFEYDIESKAKY